MRIIHLVAVALVISAPALAQGTNAGAAGGDVPAGAKVPVVAARVAAPLKDAGAYLGSAAEFAFHADLTVDHVLPSGEKLQFSAVEDVVLKRPDRLYVEWRGDLGSRSFWYDGKSVTLYDPETPYYASAAAPEDVDRMLEKLVHQLGFSPPLIDFHYSDHTTSLRGKIEYGFAFGGAYYRPFYSGSSVIYEVVAKPS